MVVGKADDVSTALAQRDLEIDWRRFAHNAVDLLCVASFDGYFHWLNPRWEEVLGRPIDEIMAKPFVEYLHPDDLERTNAEFAKIKDGVRVLSFVNRYIHKDGSVRWLEWTARPKPEEGLSYGSARDVTKVHEELRAAQSKVEALTLAEQAGGVGHWRLDLANNKVLWSPEVYRIHGYEPNSFDVELDRAIEFYHPDDRELIDNMVSSSIANRQPWTFEGFRILRPDGTVRWVTGRGQVEVDPVTDEVTALFGVFVDTTESRAMRDRLDRAERLASIGTMAAGVAHEINNPLSLIRSNSHLLGEEISAWGGASPSDRLREFGELVSEVDDAAKRIATIVSGLKSFARDTAAQIAPVRMNDIIDTAARLCRNEVRHKARLRIESAADAPAVLADEAKLAQVAINLIVNAAHAIPGGDGREHTIAVRFGSEHREGDAYGFFEVVDDGEGMSPEVLEKAFVPFFTTKPQGVGTGLGLAICHGIVSQMRGYIQADSRPGEGTTMRVLLPAAEPAGAEASSDAVGNDQAVARVLVIDDDHPVGRSTSRLLREHNVVFDTDPRRAIERIRSGERFDVVLCDIMMPDISGIELFRTIECERPELATRVIFITGGAFSAEAREFLAATKNTVLEKPLEPADLRSAVAELIAAS